MFGRLFSINSGLSQSGFKYSWSIPRAFLSARVGGAAGPVLAFLLFFDVVGGVGVVSELLTRGPFLFLPPRAPACALVIGFARGFVMICR